MARVRSPNYPALSLPAAVDRIRSVHKAEGQNQMPREVMAKHIGFGGLNGASATALSALGKYGLIETAGTGDVRVSDLAMRILFPHDASEKAGAVDEAAFRPSLFARLKERWPDRPPSDESLRSYLIREGFSASAVEQVIQFYRETIDMASPTTASHDSSLKPEANREAQVTHAEQPPDRPDQVSPPPFSTTGKPFTVAFDGARLTGSINIDSVKDIDRLMRVLKAQKAAFEAMADDDVAEGAVELSDEDDAGH